MINPTLIWRKVKRDQVLNLSELAVASSYPRGVLGKMNLPLQHGKISLSDFKRIMRRRQNAHEIARSKLRVLPSPTGSPASSPVEDVGSRQADADKFYESSSTHAGQAASRPPRKAQRLRSTG